MIKSLSHQQANLRIIELLKEEILANPDLRFGQILIIKDVLQMSESCHPLDPFYDEPQQTLKRMLGRF